MISSATRRRSHLPQAGGGDVRFTERYWYTAHPIDGSELLIDIGLGYYPNRNVMDGFAGITIGRRQHNFRASRRLGDAPAGDRGRRAQDRDRRGQQPAPAVARRESVRHQLRARIQGELSGGPGEAELPRAQRRRRRRPRPRLAVRPLARLDRRRRQALRDRAANCGGDSATAPRACVPRCAPTKPRPPVATHRNFFWTWSMFQFPQSALSIFIKERTPGKPHYLSGTEFRREADGSMSHREDHLGRAQDRVGRRSARPDHRNGRLHLRLRSRRRRVSVGMLGLPTRFYLKAGMYGGLKGWTHGDDRGEHDAAHDVWNLDDAATRAVARTLSDHVVRLGERQRDRIRHQRIRRRRRLSALSGTAEIPGDVIGMDGQGIRIADSALAACDPWDNQAAEALVSLETIACSLSQPLRRRQSQRTGPMAARSSARR